MQAVVLIIRRSREGAWIEIKPSYVALIQEVSRSREGAWIEIFWMLNLTLNVFVSLPRGSVD